SAHQPVVNERKLTTIEGRGVTAWSRRLMADSLKAFSPVRFDADSDLRRPLTRTLLFTDGKYSFDGVMTVPTSRHANQHGSSDSVCAGLLATKRDDRWRR